MCKRDSISACDCAGRFGRLYIPRTLLLPAWLPALLLLLLLLNAAFCDKCCWNVADIVVLISSSTHSNSTPTHTDTHTQAPTQQHTVAHALAIVRKLRWSTVVNGRDSRGERAKGKERGRRGGGS